MIYRMTESGKGVHLILSLPEATALFVNVANGKPADREGHVLRGELLRSLGASLFKDADRFRRLPTAWENRELDIGQTGIAKLIEQAQAKPELRKPVEAILIEAARKITRMLDLKGPAPATAAQAAGMVKPW